MSKYIDVVRQLAEPLQEADRLGVSMRDVRYIGLYDDYLRLCREGHQRKYLIAWLSEKYGVCDVYVYRIIARYEAESE